MLSFKEICLKEFYPGFGKGMRPGYNCTVQLQIGENSWDVIKVELPPETVREVVAFAVGKAMESLTLDPASINVEGLPGEPPPNDAPEFAEVDEEPAPTPTLSEEPI